MTRGQRIEWWFLHFTYSETRFLQNFSFFQICSHILGFKLTLIQSCQEGKIVHSIQNVRKKANFCLYVVAQILIIVFTVWSVGYMFFVSGTGNMRVSRSVIFRYFTVDSNLLCAVSCVFSLIQTLRRRDPGRKAVMLFRYAGTAAVTVTLMTVLLFLGPVFGYASMFSRWNLWLHLLGPILAIISFVWLERDGTVPEKKHLLLAMLPVIVYGIVYFVMVILIGREKGGWPDFYGFNAGGRWYLSYSAMLAGTALIGVVLRKLRSIQRSRDKNRRADVFDKKEA